MNISNTVRCMSFLLLTPGESGITLLAIETEIKLTPTQTTKVSALLSGLSLVA